MMRDVADNSAEIARHVIMLDGSQQKIPENVLELMFIAGNEAMNLYVKAVDTFFSKDFSKSVEILRQRARNSEVGSGNSRLEPSQKNKKMSNWFVQSAPSEIT